VCFWPAWRSFEWQFWRSYGFISEGRAWLAQLLAVEAHSTDLEILAARQQGLHAAAWLASDQHDYAQSTELFAQSTALRRALGEAEAATDILLNAARQARAEGNYQRATTLLEQALAWHRARGHGLARGSLPLTPALNAFGQALRELGLVTREQGDFERAKGLFEESLAFHSAVSDRVCVALALLGFADIARDQGQGDQVLAYGEEALTILRELGMQWGIGFTLNTLARGSLYQGDLPRALALIHESEALFRGLQADSSLVEVLITLGAVLRALGDRAAAHTAQTEALRLSYAVGPRLFVASSMEGLAVLMAEDGRAEQAAQLLSLAAALRRHMGAPVWPADQAAVNAALATTRTLLSDKAVAALEAQANTLSREELLDAIRALIAEQR